MRSEETLGIGAKLKELRERKGLTLRGAAILLGLSHSRLSDFEKGRTHGYDRPALPTQAFLEKAAKLYDFPEHTLKSLAGYSLAEEIRHYGLSQVDADTEEMADVFRNLPEFQQKLLLEIVRSFKTYTRPDSPESADPES